MLLHRKGEMLSCSNRKAMRIRIIIPKGLSGETVQIVENQVYINGKKLEEDYKTTKIDTAGIAGEKLKLGGDEYFVLGDNRKNSEDSRSADIGKVKRSYIYGKAWFVASPKKDWGFVK